MFSDLAKISVFITLMGGSHFLGLYAAGKNYKKTAMSLHLLGVGLFIAGIGLMAQIFNLHSLQGRALLFWALLAILTQEWLHRSIIHRGIHPRGK